MPEEAYYATGCTKQQVIHTCNYMFVFNPATPSVEEENVVVGDSGYVSANISFMRYHGRVHTGNFTRRANRSRTVRVGLPCTHCVHCVGFVRYTQTTSGCVRSGRERFASAWLCSVNARVDASGASGRERRSVCACLQTDLFISNDSTHMTRKGDIYHELSTCNLVTTGREADPVCTRRSKSKGMVLYSAVSSPLDRSKRFTRSGRVPFASGQSCVV